MPCLCPTNRLSHSLRPSVPPSLRPSVPPSLRPSLHSIALAPNANAAIASSAVAICVAWMAVRLGVVNTLAAKAALRGAQPVGAPRAVGEMVAACSELELEEVEEGQELAALLVALRAYAAALAYSELSGKALMSLADGGSLDVEAMVSPLAALLPGSANTLIPERVLLATLQGLLAAAAGAAGAAVRASEAGAAVGPSGGADAALWVSAALALARGGWSGDEGGGGGGSWDGGGSCKCLRHRDAIDCARGKANIITTPRPDSANRDSRPRPRGHAARARLGARSCPTGLCAWLIVVVFVVIGSEDGWRLALRGVHQGCRRFRRRRRARRKAFTRAWGSDLAFCSGGR